MNKPLPNRKSIRLKHYDYSRPGFYFITICTHNRIVRFGHISDNKMNLNTFGEIVTNQWYHLPDHFDKIKLDQFIAIPNHIHAIIQIVGAPLAGVLTTNARPLAGARDDDYRSTTRIAPARDKTVGHIIGAYKSLCVHHCLQWVKFNDPSFYIGKLWQRNYWEHIIRNEYELIRIREYIRNNPKMWKNDIFTNKMI
jgi:putative transposase